MTPSARFTARSAVDKNTDSGYSITILLQTSFSAGSVTPRAAKDISLTS